MRQRSALTRLVTALVLAALVTGAASACRTLVAGRGHASVRPPGADLIVRVPARAGTQLGYVAYLPEGYLGGTDTYPVIVFLHGLGERGNGRSELDIVSTAALPRLAATDTLPVVARGFIILAPQVDADQWDPRQVHTWLAGALASYRVDPDRIYLTGISMGGQGVFDYLALYGNANEFAAMAPISGGFQPLPIPDGLPDCQTMADTPLWAFHGGRDEIMPTQGSIQVVAYVDRVCAPPERLRLTIYPHTFHNAWDATYTLAGRTEPVSPDWDSFQPDLYSWFLQHTRSARPH